MKRLLDNNLCQREKRDGWWRRSLGYLTKTEYKCLMIISKPDPRDKLQIEENHAPEADGEKRMRSVRDATIERGGGSAARAVTQYSSILSILAKVHLSFMFN